MKRTLIVLAFAAFFVGAIGLVRAASVPNGSLIKASQPSVYYYGADGKRYVFTGEKVFFTWYADFSGVKTVSDAELASIPIGGNVTYRPGTRMVKIQSDPKVYAVDAGGVLRGIASEAVASALYGSDWASKIDDIPDAFFTDYELGLPIASASDFSPSSVRLSVPTIAADRGLTTASSAIDKHALPVGDGKYLTHAAKGYVYSCQTSFNGGGAQGATPWISGSTWDPSQKPAVQGSVSWPSASVSITTSGANRLITANGLPGDHVTGTFPISSSDPAYQYDRNPNSIKTQSYTYTLPKNPTLAASPSCVGMGAIGIAVDGVLIFNGFDAEGRDAAAHEIQDACAGHPQEAGQYHHHSGSDCVQPNADGLFGYAFDGFGIYDERDASGNRLTNDDLDECHGRVSTVTWDGQSKEMYHYVVTDEFPYTIGCFRGTSTVSQTGGGGGGGQMPPPGGFPPPPMH